MVKTFTLMNLTGNSYIIIILSKRNPSQFLVKSPRNKYEKQVYDYAYCYLLVLGWKPKSFILVILIARILSQLLMWFLILQEYLALQYFHDAHSTFPFLSNFVFIKILQITALTWQSRFWINLDLPRSFSWAWMAYNDWKITFSITSHTWYLQEKKIKSELELVFY